ncbi:hypothetical protein Tco_0784399 [Tanacetum coccineum]
MYPRFLQLFLNNQIENLEAVFNDEYVTPSRTKKIFANMRMEGKGFSVIITALFPSMLASQVVEGEDETVHEDKRDIMERAVTTASSLEAEQDSVNILGRGEDNMKLNELLEIYTKLSEMVLDLEKIKDVQALDIKMLKTRFKKLERKKKSRAPQLKRRLFKVRIECSGEKNLGDQEDAFNQGRNIADFDQDEGISFDQEDAETQGRYGYDIEVNTASTSITTASINVTIVEPVTTASAPITTTSVFVSNAEPSTPQTTTTLIEDEDLTISQTLMKMRSVESKEKSKEKRTLLQAELEEEKRLAKQEEEDANIVEWDDDKKEEAFCKLEQEEREKEPKPNSKVEIKCSGKHWKESRSDDSAVNIESLATKYPVVDWKTHILAEDKMYYQIIRADGSTKYYKIFSAMLDDFDRQDVLYLYRLVMLFYYHRFLRFIKDSVGTPVGRVILFGTIPTTIPDTTLVITPPATQTDTPSLDDDTTDSDTPDTPPSPTHGTPSSEITASTQRSPIIPRRRGLDRYPLTVLGAGDHSAESFFFSSSSEASSDFHSDTSSDPSSRHSLSEHSSPDLQGTSAGPSRKRRSVTPPFLQYSSGS